MSGIYPVYKRTKAKRDAFYDFKGKNLTGKILDDLNYQFLRRLKKEELEGCGKRLLYLKENGLTSYIKLQDHENERHVLTQKIKAREPCFTN